jgi:hypothetical protein
MIIMRRITVNTSRGGGSPVQIILTPELGLPDDTAVNKAAALVRELTGRDAAASTDNYGTTIIYASLAPMYPQPDPEQENLSWIPTAFPLASTRSTVTVPLAVRAEHAPTSTRRDAGSPRWLA